MASACFSPPSVSSSIPSLSSRSDLSSRLWRTSPLPLDLFLLSARKPAHNLLHIHGRSSLLARARAELSFGEVEALDATVSAASDDDDDDDGGDAPSLLGGIGNAPDYASVEESKLYVGNLPWSCTSEELAEVFQKVGGVEMVEVIYDRESGRSRGFGFVTMSTVEDANAAIEKFDGSDYAGRTLRVNFPNKGGRTGGDFSSSPPPRRADNNMNKLFVGNLSWSVDSDTLREVFSEHGTVVDARVVNDRDTGRSRGFGFVTMGSEDEMNEALNKLDGANVEGRNLRVNMAGERPAGRGDLF